MEKDLRVIGREAEWRVVELLDQFLRSRGVSCVVRHGTREEDLRGIDVVLEICQVELWFDLTISGDRLEEKNSSGNGCNGLCPTVIVDSRWSDKKIVHQVLRQLLCSQRRGLVQSLLGDFGIS